MALTLMTFNILEGGGDRFAGILDLLGRLRPDVLVLQECQGWEAGSRLSSTAEALGLPATAAHVHLGLARARGSGRSFHVALLSRLPIRSVRTHADPAFLGHCLVEAALDDGGDELRLYGAHFDSHSENLRFVEARYLRSLVQAEAMRSGQLLLAGDLNSLSRRDPYPPELESLLRRAGTTKYHFPPRFEVIDELESAGWIDLLHVPGAGNGTWISAPRDRGGVHIDTRTDYLMGSPRLAARLERIEVLEAAGPLSDHRPVLATLR